MTRNEIFKSMGRKDLIGQPFDEVEFLGLFHPNYNCDEIAWEGDLQKFLMVRSKKEMQLNGVSKNMG